MAVATISNKTQLTKQHTTLTMILPTRMYDVNCNAMTAT